jgi:hypothetical protein
MWRDPQRESAEYAYSPHSADEKKPEDDAPGFSI